MFSCLLARAKERASRKESISLFPIVREVFFGKVGLEICSNSINDFFSSSEELERREEKSAHIFF